MRLLFLLCLLPRCLASSPAEDIAKIPPPFSAWLAEQQCSLQEIQTLSHNKKQLRHIFHTISTLSDFLDKPCSEGTKASNVVKNRHPYFLPFDETRTCRDIEDFYVSASDVYANGQYYILCQAPTLLTLEDFWFTLISKESPLIVTLVMPEENGREKCLPFWEEGLLPQTTHGWLVERVGGDEIVANFETGRIVRRFFFCSQSSSGSSKIITQLHYENWPDNKAPDLHIILRLLAEMDTCGLPKERPITIHCSAGIGRTGTLVAIHALRKKIEEARKEGFAMENLTLNIPEEILKIRAQRGRLVASPSQLGSIYQALQQ